MNRKHISILCNCTLVVLLLSGCFMRPSPAATTPTAMTIPTNPPVQATVLPPTPTRQPQPTDLPPTAPPEPTQEPVVKQPVKLFAAYAHAPLAITPALDQEPIDPQMGNVLVPLVLSEQQLERLAAGVVVSPRDYSEFHPLYQESVRGNLPVFVTSDALLHAYHLIFDQLLSTLEEEVFLDQLRDLNQALLDQAQAQVGQLTGTAWEAAALRLYAYLAVGSRLVDPQFEIPAAVSDLAQAELALIEAAAGPAPSPIFTHLKYGEDYSQYVPRGHYTKSAALKAYFKAMMWYGRMTFRLNDPEDAQAGPDETRMALLLTLAVRDGSAPKATALELWQLLYDPTAFLVGRSDDLTIEQYLQAVQEVYGPQANLPTVADDARLADFIAAADRLPAPRILGLLSDDYKPMEAVKGLRLMGQRFVMDGYIFQELIHPKVPRRFLPSGLDVMAVMGSERAAGWLEQDPTTQVNEYTQQFEQLTAWMDSLSQAEWVETSYTGWLYALRPLLETPGPGYPLFMQSTTWQDKQLNTALGSWAELKHDTLLYAKQPYGGIGAGGFPAPPPPVLAQNYVEPVPEVFARIAALAQMTRQGLEERGLLYMLPKDSPYSPDPAVSMQLDNVTRMARQLQGMAEKELQGQPLSGDEQAVLRSFGDNLEDIVRWASGEQEEIDPAAIIADVATDPNTAQVLEVGIGNVHEIYVVAPIPQADGSLALTVARGGVFSYYEFPSPQRLTDETWRAMLENQQTPPQPAFTGGFSVPQPSSPDIQAAIYRFQRDWADWVYLTAGYNCGPDCLFLPGFRVPVSAAVQAQAQAAAGALHAQNQYEGRQWINTDYLSISAPANALQNRVVTVRETWSDFLVTYEEGANPFAWYDEGWPEPITARRGPYTVDVVYELEPFENDCPDTYPPSTCLTWRVVRFEELTARPDWVTE